MVLYNDFSPPQARKFGHLQRVKRYFTRVLARRRREKIGHFQSVKRYFRRVLARRRRENYLGGNFRADFSPGWKCLANIEGGNFTAAEKKINNRII